MMEIEEPQNLRVGLSIGGFVSLCSLFVSSFGCADVVFPLFSLSFYYYSVCVLCVV